MDVCNVRKTKRHLTASVGNFHRDAHSIDQQDAIHEAIEHLESKHDVDIVAAVPYISPAENGKVTAVTLIGKLQPKIEDVRCLRCLSGMVRHEGDGREYVAYECQNCAGIEVEISSERDEAREQIDTLRTDMFKVTEATASIISMTKPKEFTSRREAFLWALYCGFPEEEFKAICSSLQWEAHTIADLRMLREIVKSLG